LPNINNRSLYRLWESGHVLVFFLACHFFYILCPQFALLNITRQIVFLLSIAGTCAFAIEGLQVFLYGKSLEYSDIVGDMAGVLLFLSLRTLHIRNKIFYLHGLTILFIGFVIWPILCAFIDEMLIRQQFPLLADFETPFEASRFEGKTGRASISDEQAFQG
jgi:hypothetical protein